MKLDVTTTYDISQISNTKTYQELQSFIDFVNTFSRNVVVSYQNNITITDNIKHINKTLNVKHAEVVVLSTTPISTLKLCTLKSTSKIKSFKTYVDNKNQQVLQVFFDEVNTSRADRAIWLSGTIVKYRVPAIANINKGDFITFSGFGTASNNGTYLVIDSDSDTRELYCINYNRTSATGDETKTSYVGTEAGARTIDVLAIYD